MRPQYAVIIVSVFLLSCGSPKQSSSSFAPATTQQPKHTEPAVVSPWNVSVTRNELSGESNITAIDGFGDESIVIRLRGKKLDCYVTTGKFLETVENLDSRRTAVKYKFDDGEIVRQAWIISDDNTALFYPGNPAAFLSKMRRAKKFVIEYSPADTIPETESFDVSQFPSEISDNVGPKVTRP